MRTNVETDISRRVRESAASLQLQGKRQSLASQVKDLTNKVLGGWNALVPTGHGAFGLESLNGDVPQRNNSFDAVRDADPTNLMRGMKEMKMADRHISPIAEAVLTLFDKKTYDHSQLLRDGHSAEGNVAPMSLVVGRTAASQQIGMERLGPGLEAFGDDVNRLNTDDRLTMSLMIMRPWDNIMDKGLGRVNDPSPIVIMRVPSPEAWDWATTQQANSTSESRNGEGNTYRLRDLFRNPTPVNSQAKRIIPLPDNDSKQVIWNNSGSLYKCGKDVSLLDLSRDENRFTHDHIDRTDLVSDGAILDKVIVGIVDPNGGSPKTEYFALNTRPFDLAMFVISPTNKSSGQRQVMMEAVLPLKAGDRQWNGDASTITAKLTDAKARIKVRINAGLNIQKGEVQASGSATIDLVQLESGVAISAPTQTAFNAMTPSLTAYSVEAYFDEENQRKANLAVWVQYYEMQFVVPRSRIYFTEYSLSQDVDENAIAATSSIVALGNGRRGLDTIVNALNDISEALKYAETSPEIASVNSVDEQSFAAALVKPTVVTAELDFEDDELNVMNESTRLSEIHGRFRARFLSMAAVLFAKSLMLNQYVGGETPVFKLWVHSTIADIVIGILDYHPALEDETKVASGADYSMLLPNGYRLDIIKSNLDCLQQRIYAVPVIESDMTSILSAASIRDCGTVTTNYTPSNRGSVVRRVATTTREIVMMSNKVGICMIVKGLQKQLGAMAYAPVKLNADSSESLAV